MTNHIEQLMKAAGVECSTMCKPIGANCKAGCDNCERRKVFYPPFTPDKQLELIKLITDFHCFKNLDGFWDMTCVDIGKHQMYRLCCEKSFEDSLAKFTTHLIVKKLIDKAEIKRILEDD